MENAVPFCEKCGLHHYEPCPQDRHWKAQWQMPHLVALQESLDRFQTLEKGKEMNAHDMLETIKEIARSARKVADENAALRLREGLSEDDVPEAVAVAMEELLKVIQD